MIKIERGDKMTKALTRAKAESLLVSLAEGFVFGVN